MYLQKFIYVNWGNIPFGEFEFGPTNLFSGGNGSGKTTAADAIQTVMTAAHDGLFQFNPGQDESTQRGRGGKLVRTLPSYVLGCDDGAYARPESAFGYLAAIFAPHAGEDGEAFTALLAMSAFVEHSGLQKIARLDDLHFYILPDVQMVLSDLVIEDKGGARSVVPVSQINQLLQSRYGRDKIEKYDRKKTYLCRLYGALRGRADAVSEREAMNAARAFARFMAYKPIKAIDEFVANEILEPKEFGDAIRDVSSMLKRIHTMEADAKAVRASSDRLLLARNGADSFISQWLELQQLDYAGAKLRYNLGQSDYLAAKKRNQDIQLLLAGLERDTQVAQERAAVLRDEANELRLQQLQVPALRDREQLHKQKLSFESVLHDGMAPLLAAVNQLQKEQLNAAIFLKLRPELLSAQLWPALSDRALTELLNKVATKACGQPADVHALATRDWIDLKPLELQLDQAQALQGLHNQWAALWRNTDGLLDDLRRALDRQVLQVERNERLRTQKIQDINQLSAHQVNYPAAVKFALDAIRKQLPEADARVLCDHVDIVDGQWQAAIEGYIGGARFGILVEPEYEAQAIALVRSLPGRDSRARVIQGSKAVLDAARMPIDDGSVVALMAFSHDVARDYMLASYGQVMCVADAKALRGVRRGVTRDAMGAANYTLFRCDIDDAELVFGQQARVRAKAAKELELEAIQINLGQARESANRLQQLFALVARIDTNQYADIMQRLIATQRELESVNQRLALLDVSDSAELDAALALVDVQLSDQLARIVLLQEQRIDDTAKMRQIEASCKQLNQMQDQYLESLETAEQNLDTVQTLWPDFNTDQAVALAEELTQTRTVAQISNEQLDIREQLGKTLRRLDSQLMEHNQGAQTADQILFEPNLAALEGHQNFSEMCRLQRQLDGLYNRFKNNILATRQTDISAMRQSFNNAFVTNLCHAIYQAINDGKKTLDRLNLELEHHRFGADRERFYFGVSWIPEFKEYWQFFKAVIDNPALGDGETLFEMKLDKKHAQVRDRLMAMLLDKDEHSALRELTRLADYRNYRRYEIYKEPEGKAPIALSQYGTGSGGQLETPAYIIRSAAITSAFRFNEGRSHLRMVLVDEAFSKMDEHRSKEVIQYLTETLGLQLMFIMPSSKSGPFLDLVSNQFVFSKCATAQSIGELKSRVLVDRQVLNRDAVRGLMEQHRQNLRHQASLDFLDELEQLEGAG